MPGAIEEKQARYIASCFIRGLRKSYISEKNKLCYVVVEKNACSTLRNWFIDIEGARGSVESTRKRLAQELTNKFPEMSFDEASDALLINKIFIESFPSVTMHSFDQAMAAFSSEQYFRFVVVRNPYTRIFSSWADKILQDSYRPSRRYFSAADFYCRPVLTIEQCAEHFEEFLRYMDRNEGLLYRDSHWAPQFALTRPDKIAYDCIAKLEEPTPLLEALRGRLGPGSPPPLQARMNKSPLAYSREILTPGAQELICKLYAEDFKAFAYDTKPPATAVAVPRADMEAELRRILETRLRRSLYEFNSMEGRIKALQERKLRTAYYALRGKVDRLLDSEDLGHVGFNFLKNKVYNINYEDM